MACKIERETPQQAWDRISGDFSANVLGGADVIPESNEHYVISLHYAMSEHFHSLAEQMWRERDPRYACCENLVDLAAQDGFYPRPASFSQGYIKITGTPGSSLSQEMEFEINGEKYVPSGTVPGEIPNYGYVIIRVMANKPGPEGNLPSGITTGTIVNPPEGIDEAIQPYGNNFCGGSEAESCEEFRQRYLERISYQPSAQMSWIKQKIMEWPCVTDVCELGEACCTTDEEGARICPDRLEVYALFRETFPCGLAPQCVLDEMNDWLFGSPAGYGLGQMPFGVCGIVRYAKASCIDVVIDGLGCATPMQQEEARLRIKDYIDRLCPATNLLVRELEFIISQILGKASDFSVTIFRPTQGPDDLPCEDGGCCDEGLKFDNCGNAIVDCDYKVCLNEIRFVNTEIVTSGCL